MALFQKIKSLDAVTKVGTVIIIMMVLYIVFLFMLKPVFIATDTSLSHATAMGDHIMAFVSPEQRNLNITAIFLAFIAGFAIWLLIRGKNEVTAKSLNELEILKRALSKDEKLILNEIQKAGEITQDSLRFRLDWSKAKVSAILLQLDRMNIIQRQRQGKTYNVIAAKEK